MSHKDLKHELNELRHRLYKVSPLVFAITGIYIGMNIVIGIAMITAFDQSRVVASLLIVNQLLTYKFWGCVFLALAAFQGWSLYKNNWKYIKLSLLSGVVVKTFWAVGLCLRAVVENGTLLIALPWITLALIQIATVVFFLPPVYDFREVDNEDDNANS